MIDFVLSIDLTGADLIVVIPILAAAIVSVITALRTVHKVDSVDAKLTTPNGKTIGAMVDEITTVQALATPPEARTTAQTEHLEHTIGGPNATTPATPPADATTPQPPKGSP